MTLPSAPFVRKKTELNHAGLIVGQCGIAACFEGDPGVGKTMTLQCLATATLRNFYSYELSRTQPEDLQGFPIVSKLMHNGREYSYMQFVPDERLLRAGLELSLLLLDEVNNVGPAKQAPALNLVQNPPAHAWMYLACNPEESAADGQPLTCPFINRIWYGKWEIDTEAQDYGLRNRCQYPEPDVPLVPPNYLDFQPYWGNLICDYLRYKPKDRNACPKEENAKHHPWPSSRSWDNLSRALAAASAVGSTPRVIEQIVKGLVGDTVGQAFLTYLTSLKLPQPEQILAQAETFEFPARYDLLLAVLESVVNYLRQHTNTEVFERVVVLYERLRVQNQEMGMLLGGGMRVTMPEAMQQYDVQRLASSC